MNEPGRNLGLAIIVGYGFAEKPTAIRGAQRFQSVGVQTVPADPRKD
jgi:hypothetical protein